MKHVRVYRQVKNGTIPDYTILQTTNPKTGNIVYELIRYGSEWTDDALGEVAISLEDTGDGYKLPNKIGKNIGYDTAAELYILLRYLDISEKKNYPNVGGLYSGEIQITEQYETINI